MMLHFPPRPIFESRTMTYDEWQQKQEAVKADQNTCLHENFACECDVNRLSKTEGGPINRFTMDVRVKCADCGLSFRFIGLPAGLDLNGAATSIDACEGRFAIAPKGQVISVLEGEPTGFSIRNLKAEDIHDDLQIDCDEYDGDG